MILSLVQTKGGTAKSTLARGIAWSKAFRDMFDSICVLELDPQGTLASWYGQRTERLGVDEEPIKVVGLKGFNRDELKDKIVEISLQYEVLIIDVPGESVGKFATKFSMALSDLVIIPMRSSDHDEQSFMDHILPLIYELKKEQRRHKALFHVLPTFVHPRTSSARITQYFKEILPNGIECFSHHLPQRSIFENHSRDGASLEEYLKMVEKNKREFEQAVRARDDIESIAREILSLPIALSENYLNMSQSRKPSHPSLKKGHESHGHSA